MPKSKAQISVSLDGYMAGPNQSERDPLGEGGEGLHGWAFKLAAFQDAHHGEGGEGDENPSNAVLAVARAEIGAVVMGRNMFGPVRGEWGEEDWRGWWGEDPPFRTPVFVLTHHPRESFELEGGNSFHFVSGGIEAAMARAREAAGGKDVSIGGGASTLRQAIAAGELDELLVSQVPIFLGGGESLFAGLPAGTAGFELREVVRGPEALHLTYAIHS
ncbi:MAG: dihydrofolate reductase family protein [Actinobacteria bacterium]|nr:dihydrofolate reductase family protein [Actinomycetota bacterium]